MKLSVIIPTRNQAKSLERALASIAGQTLRKEEFEVIVVDNGSTDSTAEICGRLSAGFEHFTRLYDEHPGLHVGRNLGMKRSKAEILVYGDDDIEATPAWLETIARAFEQTEVALVGGRNLPIFEAAPPGWLARMWAPNVHGERICGHLSILDLGVVSRHINAELVFGCNFSIRKDVLQQVGGFNPDGMPKDLLRFRGDGETHVSRFVERHALATLYHPGATVGHHVPRERLTAEYFCARSFRQGISDSFSDLRAKGTRGGPCQRVVRDVRALVAGLRLLTAPYPLRQLASARQRGYRFHQQQYSRDPLLRQWVHRCNYLNELGHIPDERLQSFANEPKS